jgi:hypothetical protein
MGGQLYVKQSSAEGADRAVTWAVTRWFQCLSRHFQWPPGWSCSAGGRGRLAGPGLITGSDATLNPYAPKHNPAIFFDGIEGAAGVWSATSQSAECLANDTPAGTTGPDDMSIFNAATEAGTVARYNMIVPNLCEDAHDSCNQPPGNRIMQFDRFLQREVPLIEASPAFGTDGVLIITFDEGTLTSINNADKFGSGGRTAFAVVARWPCREPTPRPPTTTACCGRSRTGSASPASWATPPP